MQEVSEKRANARRHSAEISEKRASGRPRYAEMSKKHSRRRCRCEDTSINGLKTGRHSAEMSEHGAKKEGAAM